MEENVLRIIHLPSLVQIFTTFAGLMCTDANVEVACLRREVARLQGELDLCLNRESNQRGQ